LIIAAFPPAGQTTLFT